MILRTFSFSMNSKIQTLRNILNCNLETRCDTIFVSKFKEYIKKNNGSIKNNGNRVSLYTSFIVIFFGNKMFRTKIFQGHEGSREDPIVTSWRVNSRFFLQRNCIEFALKAKPVRRYIPKHRIQYKVWWFVTSQPFEYTIFILIMINTVTLAMKFYRQPQVYTEVLDVLNMIFTAVFALEFVFKLAAFRFKVQARIYV